jgi:outer membrane lipoprotein-sorting protein
VVLGRVVRSRGELCQEQPAYFSMAFSDPQGDRVVADGEWLWLYYPSTDERQVLRTPMDRGLGRFDFAREFLDGASERYRASLVGREAVGEDTQAGPGATVETVVLELEPRTSAPFVHARLWIDPERLLLVRVRTEEPNGSVRTVELSDIRLNPEIDPEIFRFVPPDGADVITRGP